MKNKYEYLLEIKDYNNENIVYGILLFKSYLDRSSAIDILENARNEWNENCLEDFINNFDDLDEETKPLYEDLLWINSVYEYQLHCLGNSKIDYIEINDIETTYI